MKKQKKYGCTNSHFENSSGEHSTEHYSTAYDMALIGKYAMKFDVIKSAASQIKFSLPATELYEKDDRVYYTANEMLLTGSKNYYRYSKGVKTGFTTPAGYCLMVYAEKNGLPVIAVVMKSTTQNSRYDDAKEILNYSFDNNVLRTIAESGTNMQTIYVKKGSKDTKKLNAILAQKIIGVVKAENKNLTIEPKVVINEKLKAPIEKGTVIGKATYEVEGRIYESDVIAETDVKKSKVGVTFLLIFIGVFALLGGLRGRSIYKRTKTLRKIRGK